MGVSTNGQICYGVPFEDEFAFPWDDDPEGLEGWWRTANGYVNPLFNPYDEQGDYKPGVTSSDPRIDKWYEHRSRWDEEYPLPVELVNVCSGDCPMYILAVPASCRTARRGYPERFEPSSLVVSDEDRRRLLDFCRDAGIEISSEAPAWYLSSYYG